MKPEDRLKIDARLGDSVLRIVEGMTGKRCHMVMIVFPVHEAGTMYETHEELGQPTFVSSLDPEDTHKMLIKVGDWVSKQPDGPIIQDEFREGINETGEKPA